MLKVQEIKDAKHSGIGKTPLKLSDGNGLQLHVFPNERKTWIYSYRFKGKQKNITLGKFPAMTATVARSIVLNLKRQIEEEPNQEPSLDDRKNKSNKDNEDRLFGLVMNKWLEYKEAKLARSTYIRNAGALQKHVLPVLGKTYIDEITDKDVLNLAFKMQSQGKNEMAKRVVRLIGQILQYSRIRLGKTKFTLSHGLTKELDNHEVKNMPRISITELPQFIKDIQCYNGEYTSISAIKLMMLCFVRTGELRGMKWSEIDWENKLWRIPAERMKARRPHLVPLSKKSLEILNNLKLINGHSEYVFYSTRCKDNFISSHTILGAIKRMGYSGKMTGHGFRGLASTFLHEQGFLTDAIDRQLAHVKKDKISAAYDHSMHLAVRKEIMEYWSDYVCSKGLKIQSL